MGAENKRFTYKHFDWLQWHIYKDGEFFIEVTNCEEDAKMLCDLLNELSEENRQLKQFKEDVFNKIDMHLHMLPIARDNEFNEEYGDPSLYSGAIYMLETLKKELQQ